MRIFLFKKKTADHIIRLPLSIYFLYMCIIYEVLKCYIYWYRTGFYWTAFFMVILHDFLDHLDGIVAKAQKQTYGSVDDPLLGGFMDAFCDKVSAAIYFGIIYLF